MAGSVEIYFHPSCETSYELIKGLARAGLLDSVRLVRSSSLSSVRHGVLSVPWVKLNGVPAATDPVTSDEVIAMIRGDRLEVDDEVEAFMNSVLHSSMASAVALLHGSLVPVATRELASAAVRSPASGIDPGRVVKRVVSNDRELFSEWRDKLRRALAVSFVRELYWASNGSVTAEAVAETARPEVVGLWLIGKGSLGRASLPPSPKGSAAEDLVAISEFIRKGARGLLLKVREEQESIYSDAEYQQIVSKALSADEL
mgnify:CR=1 FL=1